MPVKMSLVYDVLCVVVPWQFGVYKDKLFKDLIQLNDDGAFCNYKNCYMCGHYCRVYVNA